MTLELFDQLVSEAYDQLPQEFQQKLENVAITVEAWPNHYQLSSVRMNHRSGLLFGLYQGVPRHQQSTVFNPARITLFAGPILRISRSFEHLKENIKRVLKHEIGHHFGMSDHFLHGRGY